MTRRTIVLIITLISLIFSGCRNYKTYNLTIHHRSFDGSEKLEKQTLYASSDSAAYAQGIVIYLLALHAGKRLDSSAKRYMLRPIGYSLVDESGHNIDSAIGPEMTHKIRGQKEAAIQ